MAPIRIGVEVMAPFKGRTWGCADRSVAEALGG